MHSSRKYTGCLSDTSKVGKGVFPFMAGSGFLCCDFIERILKNHADCLHITIICILLSGAARQYTKSYLITNTLLRKITAIFFDFSLFYRIATYLPQIFAGAYCHTRRRCVPEPGTAMPGHIVDLRLHHPYNKQRPYMNRLRHIAITLLMLMAAFPLSAQEKADSVFMFRFLPGKDGDVGVRRQ